MNEVDDFSYVKEPQPPWTSPQNSSLLLLSVPAADSRFDELSSFHVSDKPLLSIHDAGHQRDGWKVQSPPRGAHILNPTKQAVSAPTPHATQL